MEIIAKVSLADPKFAINFNRTSAVFLSLCYAIFIPRIISVLQDE